MLTISSCVKYNDNAWSLLDFVGFCSGTNYNILTPMNGIRGRKEIDEDVMVIS
jgi:hypothetical protein